MTFFFHDVQLHSTFATLVMVWNVQSSAKSAKWPIPVTFYAGCVTSAVVVLGIMGGLYVKKVQDGCVDVSIGHSCSDILFTCIAEHFLLL